MKKNLISTVNIKGEFRFCVIECAQKHSGLILVTATGERNQDAAAKKPCWNILYTAPFDAGDQEGEELAFTACMVWLEANANDTSEYVIQDMFFYSK